MTIFVLTFILSFLFVIFNNKISKLVNIFDYPDKKRKLHKAVSSPVGGILIFLITIIFIIDLFFFKEFFLGNNISLTGREALVFVFGSFLIFFIGLLDDKYNLDPNKKFLFFSLLYFSFMQLDKNLIISEIFLNDFRKSIELKEFSIFFSVLCCLLFLNALNMFDGINYQVATYSIIIFSIFLIKGIFITLCITVIIGLIFFLYLNYKNNIFLGNSGTFLLAFLISYIFIRTYNSTRNIFAIEEIFAIMFLPGAELLRLFFFRIIKGNNPFKSDRHHIHHLLSIYTNSFKAFIINIVFIILGIFFYYFFSNKLLYFIILFLIYFIFIFYLSNKVKKN
jgi:UDP-N-acetylmuramyl pentapeptide phosphotransferase/UDP-N-acetylglucosamine-1-phosphate transferase